MLNYQFWGQLGLFKLSRAGQMHLGGFLGTLFSLKTQPRAVWIWGALAHLQPPDTDDHRGFCALAILRPQNTMAPKLLAASTQTLYGPSQGEKNTLN